MEMRQDAKTPTKKQSQSGRNSQVQGDARGNKGSMLMNISQILLGEGILTNGSDKQAIAAALVGLSQCRNLDAFLFGLYGDRRKCFGAAGDAQEGKDRDSKCCEPRSLPLRVADPPSWH